MRLAIYLNYRGNCEEAFRFYEQHLGARVTGLVRHGEQPDLLVQGHPVDAVHVADLVQAVGTADRQQPRVDVAEEAGPAHVPLAVQEAHAITLVAAAGYPSQPSRPS